MKRKRIARKPDQARYDRFVAEYLTELNATKAAIAAGYSKKTARQQGARLLTVVYIANAVKEAMAARAERTGITQDRVLLELEQLAFSNIDHYIVDDNGRVELREGAPADAIKAISRVKHKKTTKEIPQGKGDPLVITEHEVEIALWDKPTTLKLAGRHVGLFPERVEVTGKNGGPFITPAELKVMPNDELRAALRAALASVPA